MINKDKWWDILQHFIDVLHINIFILDPQGQIILPPYQGRYGAEFLENKIFGLELSTDSPVFFRQFEKHENYLEYHNHTLDLHHFAIPMSAENGKLLAYMIVGPVILNKRLDSAEYKLISDKLQFDFDRLLSIINEVRVVSYITIKSILDLLAEVSKYVIQLSFQGQKMHNLGLGQETFPPQISKAAQDIYSSICLDELLVTLLDVALSLTKAECGSIMILDKKRGGLMIKVSRGIDAERAKNTQVKLGEGIAGLAAKERIPFVIRGTTGDKRILHLLKRPEIRHALVIPICLENTVYGILNVHSKNEENNMTDESLNVVQNLSRLTSAAINSIQQQSYPV